MARLPFTQILEDHYDYSIKSGLFFRLSLSTTCAYFRVIFLSLPMVASMQYLDRLHRVYRNSEKDHDKARGKEGGFSSFALYLSLCILVNDRFALNNVFCFS